MKGFPVKLISLFAALMFSMTGAAIAADKQGHPDDHKPLYGGVVVEGKEMDYELVAKPDTLRLYLRDHGKPKSINKATAKITLLFGTEKQVVELKPAGDKLEAKGAFKVAPGTKAVALVNVDGKSLTARFVLK